MAVKSGGMLWGPPRDGRVEDQGRIEKVVSWIMGTCYVDVIFQLPGPSGSREVGQLGSWIV